MAGGERVLADDAPDAWYVQPALVTMPAQTEVVRTETFGPLLYVLAYDDLDEAIALHNGGAARAGVEHLHQRRA